MLTRVPAGCSRVVRYGWNEQDGGTVEYDALDVWPLVPGLVDGYVVFGEAFQQCREADYEVLENGDVRPLPIHRGRKYYNRSRRSLIQRA